MSDFDIKGSIVWQFRRLWFATLISCAALTLVACQTGSTEPVSIASGGEDSNAAATSSIEINTISGVSGTTEQYTAAISRYQQQLQVIDRETDPLIWAQAQNAIGYSWLSIGLIESDIDALRQAIPALKKADEVLKSRKDQDPISWAINQSNLADAMLFYGRGVGDPSLIMTSIFNYASSQTVWTVERDPLEWARLESNKGNAIRTYALKTNDTNSLKLAANTYQSSLTQRTRERQQFGWAETTHNLANVLKELSKREERDDFLISSINLYSSVLEVRKPHVNFNEWYSSMFELGDALLMLGRKRPDEQNLTNAIAVNRTLQRVIEQVTGSPSELIDERIAEAEELLNQQAG